MKYVNMNKQNENGNLFKSQKRINTLLAGIFVAVIFGIFPLVFHDYYFDILDVKYIFYYVSVLILISLFLLAAAVFLYKDKKEKGIGCLKNIRERFSWHQWKAVDWAMIAFFAAAAISTFQSEYFYESFWGNEGRFCGLFLIMLYTASFFIISKCLDFKQWYLDIFLAAGMIACMIGILQYFNIDPIGFKADISPKDYDIFTSTFGNINTYTSYVALLAGVSTVLFAIEKNIWRSLWYLLCVVISFMGLITGISDNAYLTLFALFGLLPLYLFNCLNGVKKYVLLTAVLGSEFQIFHWINETMGDRVLELNGFFNVILGFQWLGICVAVLWITSVLLYIFDAVRKKSSDVQKYSNTGRWIWLGVLAAAAGVLLYILYDVNIQGNTEAYSSLHKYLLFNDDWGTHRGYIWRISMECYKDFPFIHKIFGFGPDTFGILTVQSYYDEMISLYNEKFDSVHNEYLQYLVTLGIVGLAAYVSFIVLSIKEMVRSAKKEPAVMAIVFAVICYCAQATVNISVPVVAPIMFTLVMTGIAAGRKEENCGKSRENGRETV